MHPSEQVLNDIYNKLDLSVNGLKNVFWVDEKVGLQDLPACIINVTGESIEEYHNHFYKVVLDVELKYIVIDEGFNRDATKILTIADDADALLKDITTRLPNIMRFSEVGSSELEDSADVERPLLMLTRNYGITYKRTRGLS